MPHTYDYPRAALTVDCVVFGLEEAELKVLLIQRSLPPWKSKWALPGGFVQVDETLDAAARRELTEETGLSNVCLEQLYTFAAVDRDPRERVVSVACFALVKSAEHPAAGASDAPAADWFPVTQLPALAFDHGQTLNTDLARLRAKVRHEPIGFELLPPTFTLSQFQQLYKGLSRWHSKAWEKARAKATEVRTRLGRRRLISPEASEWERFTALVNTEVQGGAADGMKPALVELAPRLPPGVEIISTVHDELFVEAPSELAGHVRDLTRTVMIEPMAKLYPEVPVEVEAHSCAHWGEKS